MPEYKVDFLRK